MCDTEKKQRKPNGYWNVYEHCMEEAKKYSTRNEFQEKNAVAYSYTHKNGWMDDCVWFVNGYKIMGKRKTKWTYDTCYKEAQKYKTKVELEKNNGTVYNLAQKNNWMKDYTWFEETRKPNGYWTKERCFEAAKECKTRSEFQKTHKSAYSYANKNGWLKDYTWFEEKCKPNGYWKDYDNCYNEAKKYNTRSEFEKGCGAAYNSARINGWIDDYVWLERKINPYRDGGDNVYAYFFNDLNAVYVGRTIDPKGRNIQHNKKENCTVLRFANKNNVSVPEMTILKSGLTVNEGKEKEDYYRKKYEKEGWNVINIAKTGIQSGSVGSLSNGKWNHKSCYKEALKYSTLKDFRKNSQSAYNSANTNGWLKEYTWLERQIHKIGYWTFERCLKEAQKYNTRSEFEKGNGSAYTTARKNGWLNNYTWFEEIKKQNGYWNNYDNCYNAAKECTKRSEFKKKYYQGWYESLKNGWINDYTWFIDGNKVAWQRLKNREDQSKCVCQYSLDGEFIKEWPSLAEIERQLGFAKANISACCKNKYGAKTRYGYIWRFAA